MKKSIPVFFFLLITNLLFAQTPITVTNSIFPQAGDMEFTSRDTATPGVIITPPSSMGQTWVYDNFIPRFVDTTHVLAASDGTVASDYPEADIIIPQLGGEGYTKVLEDSLEVIGFYGDGGFGFGTGFNVPLNPTMIVIQTPLNYGDTFEDAFGFQTQIAPSDFPGLEVLLDSLLPAGITIDSIRVNYTSTRNDTVDAWGTLTTGHGTFEVLRSKRVDIADTGLEVKAFGIWLDPSTLPGVPTLPFVGLDTTVTYDFISDTEKVQIMSVQMDDEGGIALITYKIDPSEVIPISAIFEPLLPLNSMNAYPNPAQEEVRFEFQDVPTGNYELQLYDLAGRLVKNKSMSINGNVSLFLNLKELVNGSYLYSLKDNMGRLLLTKRLVIAK